MEKIFEFNHEVEYITDALNLPKDIDQKCTEIIMFATIANYCVSTDMFDKKSDAPRNLTTRTGDLEKALSLCSNKQEVYYILLMFNQIHQMANKCIGMTELDEENKKKLNIIFSIMELEMEHKGEDVLMKPSDVVKRIKIVRKSNYNFDIYLQLLNGNSVDDMINNILKGDD